MAEIPSTHDIDNIAKPRRIDYTIASALLRECALWSSAPQHIAAGVGKRVAEIQKNPMSAVPEVLTAAALGATVAYFAKNPAALATTIRVVAPLCKNPEKTAEGIRWLAPHAGAAMVGADLGLRAGVPSVDTLLNPTSLEKNKILLGSNLGSAVVDYPLMGLAGTGGALSLGLTPKLASLSTKVFDSKTVQHLMPKQDKLIPAFATSAENPHSASPNITKTDAAKAEIVKSISSHQNEHRDIHLATAPNAPKLELPAESTMLIESVAARKELKYKPVANCFGSELGYEPHDDALKMLSSVFLSNTNGKEDFYFLKELLNSSSVEKILKRLPGKWEPESSTHESIELRSPAGEIVNIKFDYGTPACPLLLQPLEQTRVGSYTIEKLPHFTRPFMHYANQDISKYFREIYRSQVKPMIKTLESLGCSTGDEGPMNIAELENGWRVFIDPRSLYEAEYPGHGHDIDHQKASKIYSAALHNLTDIYGESSSAINNFKIGLANHFNWLKNNRSSERLYLEALKSSQQTNDYKTAYKAAEKLISLNLSMSNRGMNSKFIDKAESYTKLHEQLYKKFAEAAKNPPEQS